MVATDRVSCVTFCVAARNERDTLPGVVEAIRSSTLWKMAARKELLICVNGSTDGTDEVAQRLLQECPEMALVDSGYGSKGRARNLLVAASSRDSPVLFFVDADVRPAPDTFEKLLEALEEDPNLVLAGGCAVPVPPERMHYSFIQRCFAQMLSEQVIVDRRVKIGLVPGCCYAIRRNAAVASTVPEEPLVGEDTVLNALFPEHKRVVPGAMVEFIPPGFFDRIRVSARHRRSFELLRRHYPRIFESFQRCYSKPFRATLFGDFLRLPLTAKPVALIAFLAMAVGSVAARLLVRNLDQPWHSPKSTKMRIKWDPPGSFGSQCRAQ